VQKELLEEEEEEEPLKDEAYEDFKDDEWFITFSFYILWNSINYL
jgi:hypothetical protein